MDHNRSDLWKTYPKGDKSLIPIGVDEERYYTRFLQHSSRLFVSQGERLEIIRIMSGSGEEKQFDRVESASELDRHIKINTSSSTQDALYLIPQQTSWGPLQVSSYALRLILASHYVFVPFLDVVQAYGSKRHADEHIWSGARWKLSQRSVDEDDRQIYEFCYNLPYVELNGRNEGVPWSLRQCGVYQQICLKTQRSTCILLHISGRMRTILDQESERRTYKNAYQGLDPMLPHLVFLSAMAGTWQDHLEYLRLQLAFYDEKACFSSVDHGFSHDYSVTFLDSQNLQLLQQKLFRMSTILNSCYDIVKNCESHCHKLIASKVTNIGENCLAEIAAYSGQLHYHRRELNRIIQNSSGISKLLFTILDYRDTRTLRESSHAIKSHLNTLQHITSSIQGEDIQLAGIARQTQKESRRLQTLSTVATVYLPASLIATLFSSSLLQLQANDINNPAKGSHIVISPQFWIFVVTSIVLAAVTLAYPLFWDKRLSRTST